jgi:hypothetical protein
MSHWDLVTYVMTNGTLSPIWQMPYLDARIFRVDWLHCADMGCAADYVGNLLWLMKDKFPGRSHKERVAELWLRTRANDFSFSIYKIVPY